MVKRRVTSSARAKASMSFRDSLASPPGDLDGRWPTQTPELLSQLTQGLPGHQGPKMGPLDPKSSGSFRTHCPHPSPPLLFITSLCLTFSMVEPLPPLSDEETSISIYD